MTPRDHSTYIDEAADLAVDQLATRIARQIDEQLHGVKSALHHLDEVPVQVEQMRDEMVTAMLVHQQSEELAQRIASATSVLATTSNLEELRGSLNAVLVLLPQIAGHVSETRLAVQKLNGRLDEAERGLQAIGHWSRALTEHVDQLKGAFTQSLEQNRALARADAQALAESIAATRKELGEQLRALPKANEATVVQRELGEMKRRQERLSTLLWSVVGLQVVVVVACVVTLLAR